MTGEYSVKKLLVEGEQEKRIIPELMKANGITWEDAEKNPIVLIEPKKGDQFINQKSISLQLKTSDLTALGIIVDADNDLNARWDSVKNACSNNIDKLPEQIPESGLICRTTTGVKFGVWIMPDNKNQGMLENFLAYLIPDESEPVWQYAQEATREASNRGAKFKNSHQYKANIYTWLAWQNPPGRQPHTAITAKILDPNHPKAQTFVSWFKQLYDL